MNICPNCSNNNIVQKWDSSVTHSQLLIFSGLCIQSSVTVYDPIGSCTDEAYDTTCIRVYCTGNLYHLNQELKFLYRKIQIPSKQLYRASPLSMYLTMQTYVAVCRNIYEYEIL